jgi:glycerol-3-phosphate acyltransferase PlsY
MPWPLWFALAFLSGSLPFSVWIGRLALGADIRTVGDANPGATNVLRAAGKSKRRRLAGVVAILLDSLKAFIPVLLAREWGGVAGRPLALVAVAPVLGHAFSPFLRFRGGKAVASTFGTWAALTLWEGPTVLGLGMTVMTRFFAANGWAVLIPMTVMGAWLLLTPPAWNGLGWRPPPPVIALAWLLNTAILAWKHRADLRRRPVRKGRE